MRFLELTTWILPASLLLSACGAQSVAAPLVCDPAREGEIVFGYQALPGGRITQAARVLAENGTSFLFIDGACGYWAYEPDYDSAAGMWTDVRHGRLSEAQLEGVNADLVERDWGALADTDREVPREAGSSFWLRGWSSGCQGDCAGERLEVVEASGEWIHRLYMAGEAFTDASLRVEAVADPGALDDPNIIDWGGIASLASLVRPEGNHELYGGRAVIDGADADLVRTILEPFRLGERGTFAAAALPLREGGEGYWLYARPSLPIDDADGLVRAPW